MVRIKYTEAQIKELKSNKYVKNCTNKNINFTLECKQKAVQLWNQWFFTKNIFKELWFPKYIYNSNIPSVSLNRWRKNIKKWSIEFQKWRPVENIVDYENMTLEQENEYLKTKLSYYEELKKLVDKEYP